VLRQQTHSYYGAPIRAYLTALIEQHATDPDALPKLLAKHRADFLRKNLPEGSSAQVQSVCGRFALVAAAGSLATTFGLTGWPDDEADRAAAICFKAWLGERSGAGDHEIEAGIRQVVAFIEQHGASRFEDAWADRSEGDRPERVINRVGFRRNDDGRWRYYVLPEMWRAEVTKGFDAKALARAMVERKLIVPGKDGKPAAQVHVPAYGKPKLYVLSPEAFAGEEVKDAG